MNFTIVCVGKLKERFWSDACAEYVKRLGAYGKLRITEVADVDPGKAGGEDAALEKEAAALLKAIPERAHTMLLAIDGRERSSEDLAQHLDDLALSGIGEAVFVIGGSCGVAPSVRKRADETLSFGPITLPHNLARVVLLEQLYRCARISHREPYHK